MAAASQTQEDHTHTHTNPFPRYAETSVFSSAKVQISVFLISPKLKGNRTETVSHALSTEKGIIKIIKYTHSSFSLNFSSCLPKFHIYIFESHRNTAVRAAIPSQCHEVCTTESMKKAGTCGKIIQYITRQPLSALHS